MCEVPRARGRTRACSNRRSRVPPRAADRVDGSHAWRWADDHGFGKRWPGAAGLGEASQGLLPAPLVGDLERDPTVEIDVLELNVRRVALRPPGIGQVLLRRVRDGARPQEEDERRDEKLSARVSHGLRAG
jgi:hypothetical protein